MSVGPRHIRNARLDSLVNIGTPASNDGVLIIDLTDGLLKTANASTFGLTTEEIQDNLGTSFIVGGTRITTVYDDVGNTLTFNLDALDAGDITTGTFADARISQSSVTQHQAALSITESQISDLAHLTIEQVQDSLGTSFVVGGTDITVVYDDVANTLTINKDALVAADIPNLDTSKITTGTFADARISQSSVTQHQAALTITESQVNDLNHLTIEEVQDNLGTLFIVGGTDLTAVYNDVANTLTLNVDALDAAKITTGTFADARISQSSVTQHQAALSITESQISDLDHWTSADHTALAGSHVTNGDTHDHAGGDGAQVDHGGLAGLADDDHTQYLNNTRHDVTTRHPTTVLGDGSGLGLRQIVTFTANGSFTKSSYPWLRAVRVRLVGGGGGGGGAASTTSNQAAAGQTGGGGGYSEKVILASALASSETVTVGSGGTGGTAGNNNGSNGGSSSFGTHLSATGGSAGQGSGATGIAVAAFGGSGGTGGTGSSGDINIRGGTGGYAIRAQRSAFTGPAGSSILGTGAHGQSVLDTNSAGSSVNGYGGGGGGGLSANASGSAAGGSGGAGIVIVELYA